MKKSVMTALLALLSAATCAATEGVSPLAQFRAFPESILLADGEETDLTWMIHNPNEKELSLVGVNPLPVEGVAVSFPRRPSPEEPLVIAGRGDASLAVKIRRTGDIREDQKVYFQFDGLIEKVGRKAFASVTVGRRAAPEVDKIASLAVEAKLESINEHCPGWVYLVVTNKSHQPITVGRAQVLAPEFVSSIPEPNRPFSLTGQNTQTVSVKICVNSKVRPGNHLLVFDIPVTQTQNGEDQVYHLVQKQAVTVGIMGESDVLKVLQIPSFLLLPGVLAVLTAGFLWRRFSEPAKKGDFPLPYLKEDFWLVGVTVSIVIALLYPFFTAWCLHEKRDYLYGYGLKDIVWIWLLGMGAGVVGSILYTSVRRWKAWHLKRQEQREEQRRRTDYPTGDDNPWTLLSKLQRQGLTLRLEKVRLANQKELFLLQKRTSSADKYWFGPEIAITLPKGLDSNIEGAITEQLDSAEGSPELLLQQLKEGNVSLTQAAPPVQMPASDIQRSLGRQPFVALATT
jgi:hypothetical protein